MRKTLLSTCRTVDDLSVGSNVFGMFVAGLAVVSSGMQQIYVGTMQAKHKLNANELLSNTAPAQARAAVDPVEVDGITFLSRTFVFLSQLVVPHRRTLE